MQDSNIHIVNYNHFTIKIIEENANVSGSLLLRA